MGRSSADTSFFSEFIMLVMDVVNEGMKLNHFINDQVIKNYWNGNNALNSVGTPYML